MGDEAKSYELDSGKTISSLDDVPEIAKIAKRQLFLNKWYRPIALAWCPIHSTAFRRMGGKPRT